MKRDMIRNLVPVLLFVLLSSPASAQVTSVIVPTLPTLPGTEEKGGKDPDAIYCRPPLSQSDSRLPGPKTCRTNRTWDELHAQGLDIGADGKSVVASEKYRSVRGQ